MSQRPPAPSAPAACSRRARPRPPGTAARATAIALGALTCAVAAACDGPQSALDPAGRDAERLASLFTWMAVGATIIWLAVVGLALWVRRSAALATPRGGRWLVIGGGVVFPLVVLSTLLVVGLAELPATLAPAPDDRLVIEVTGRQWWWRVRYLAPGAEPVELANEIRLPVGRRLDVRLLSDDVVHSFWVPSLTGKMDMVPGRTNRIAVEPTRTGTFRGACAEYCGLSHARMNLVAVVLEPAAFDAWLAAQRDVAQVPEDPAAQRGAGVFVTRGCVTCHTIRGTGARGRLGPDLTHVGGRETLAAGLLPGGAESLARWIRHTERLKPGVHMPAYASLPDDALAELAAYLAQLR